jgi:hypothetical protein
MRVAFFGAKPYEHPFFTAAGGRHVITYLDAHLNLIRHGREVCHARNPACQPCRLLDLCTFGQERGAT